MPLELEDDAIEFGTDVSTFFGDGPEGPDLDPNFGTITGRRVVAEAVLRRWTMRRRELLEDLEAGEDVRGLINAKTTPARLRSKQSALSTEAEKDERVRSCDVLIILSDDGKKLRIKGTIFPMIGGPFTVVVDPETVTVELLDGIR